MLRSKIVECIALLMLTSGATSAEVQTPSFDCARASAPDERAICADPQLATLDRLIAEGYGQLKNRLGTTIANQVHLPFLRARRACGGNTYCIFERQAEEIPSFQAVGITLTTPPWLDAHSPHYSALKAMLKVGECAAATIQDVSYRLCSPDGNNVCIPTGGSGTSVTLSNEIIGVSYENVPPIYGSQVGDPVIACLVQIPKDCPPGDDRGYVWSVTNLLTKGHWELPDAEHLCGGA